MPAFTAKGCSVPHSNRLVYSAPRRLLHRLVKALRLLEVSFHGAHELRLVTLPIAQLANHQASF